ncbi:aqualysin-1-like [Apostichopus japonicus]|uniref:aqualysin-1-like n=1 Tax=Stichopus japonicus TaxID=307972 RepID=UPI003AB71A47
MKFVALLLLVAAASAELAPLLRAREPVPGSYIIRIKDSFDVSLLADSPILTALGGRVALRYKRVLHGFSAKLSESALSFVRNSGIVEYVEEDGVARKAYSWGIDRVNQISASLDNNKDYTTGSLGAGANVFVIDTGIDPNNPEFGGRAAVGDDFVTTGKQMNGIDCDGHGTHCSGTVGSSSYGVATGVNIWGVRVLNCQGSGTWSAVIAGCDFAADSSEPLKVASLSIGGGVSVSVNDAIQRMIDADVAVAVAAGNEDSDACNSSPASAPNCLTVGASDDTDTRASFSNFGSCVDIFAPGVAITSTVLDNGVASWAGTSMATPHVAGVMALARVEYPAKTAEQIMAHVKSTASTGLISDPQGSDNNLLYCP